MGDRARRHSLFATSPALLPAAAWLAGVRLGLAFPAAPIGTVVVLAWLGLALGPAGRGMGRWIAVAALGLLVGAAAGRPGWAPDPDRPVAAVAEVTGHWRRFDDSWSAPVRIVRVRQGLRLRTREMDGFLRLPGAEEPPVPGTRLRVRGHLRRAPGLGNVPPLPPGPWRLKVKSRLLVEVVAEGGLVGRWSSRLRRRVEEAYRTAGARTGGQGGPGATETASPGTGGRSPARPLALPLLRALVLGDGSRMPLSVRQGLRRTGLAHVLAVSGLHVGLVAAAVLFLGSWLPRRVRLASSLAVVVLYLLVVGPRPSLVRASVMACLGVMALLAERPPQAVNALAVAAAGIAAVRPEVLLDVGFRLTVGATAGIVLLGPALAARWLGGREVGPEAGSIPQGRGWRGGLVRSLAASVAAQVGVLPWALPVFVLLTPWAPLANLVAVPWTALALAACLGWTGLACLVPEVASAGFGVLELLAAPFAWPAAFAPRPWIAVPVAVGTAGAVAWAAGVGAASWHLPRIGRLGVVAVAAGVLGAAGLGPGGSEGVELVVIDVGQGDAILLRDGAHAALVDGGGWRHGDLGGRVLLPVLAHRGVRRLETVLVTHPDRDHCGGLIDVAGYLAVDEVSSGPGIGDSSCGRALDGLPGVDRREVVAGGQWNVGRWRLRVLHPEAGTGVRGRRRASGAGDNEGSVVLAAEAFGRRVLLTGDLGRTGEARLLRRASADLDSDVLKVGHHGSRSSTGAGFLRAVDPRIALVSAGARNPYGHPAREVLARLRRAGVHTVRTDRDGMVVVGICPDGSIRLRLPGAPKAGRATLSPP